MHRVRNQSFRSRIIGTNVPMKSNNTLERTGEHCGRFVLAIDCVLAEAEKRPWRAAQLGR